MDKYLEDRGLKESSRYNYHKILKSFVIQAFEDGLIVKNPYSKMKIKRGDEDGLTRFLTPAEFHRFETCKIDSEHLARVRDLFVFLSVSTVFFVLSSSELKLFLSSSSCSICDSSDVTVV